MKASGFALPLLTTVAQIALLYLTKSALQPTVISDLRDMLLYFGMADSQLAIPLSEVTNTISFIRKMNILVVLRIISTN